MLWIIGSGSDDRRADFASRHDAVVVGWAATGDLAGVGSAAAVRQRLAAVYPDAPAPALDTASEQLWSFVAKMTEDDFVVVPLKRTGTALVGKVTGAYVFAPGAPPDLRHQRPVRWLRQVARGDLDHELRDQLDSGRAVTRARAATPTDDQKERRAALLSRRSFLVGGAVVVAGGIGAAAAVLQPWRAESGVAATRHRQVAPSTTTTTIPPVTPSPNGPVAAWVVAENAKPGTTAWNVNAPGKEGDIEGYAGAVSAKLGDTVTVYVSTVAPTFHVEAYRLGWYGGTGGRLVWQSPEIPGKKQAPATLTPGVNTSEARWEPSLQLSIDAAFVPGVYFLKLVGSTGIQHLVPLTVRDDASTAAYVVQNSVTTWQAYNEWGGYSLYNGPRSDYGRRARVVSFDRPYKHGIGQADFLGIEFPLIQLMEQLGLDVTYITDVDTHAHPELLPNHKAFFSLGHDEYWSKEMRDGVEGARDKGLNLAFLGANTAYRQIRFEPSPLGPNRHQVCYKSPDEDPIRKTNPELVTTNWRAAPVSRPESQMIGQQYESHPARADMVVVNPANWVYAGTNVQAGQHLAIVVGNEYDRYDPRGKGVPQNVEILAHSPLTVNGVKTFSDMIYWTAPSGAGIFSTGSIFWVSKLTPPGLGSPNNPIVVQIMKNVLAAFGNGPTGQAHPSVPNYDAIVHQYGTTSKSPSAGD